MENQNRTPSFTSVLLKITLGALVGFSLNIVININLNNVCEAQNLAEPFIIPAQEATTNEM